MISIKNITEKNVHELSNLHPGQKNLKYVSTAQETIIDAAYKKQLEYVKAIYKGDKAIGILWYSPLKKDKINIFRFMIDENYQGKGYGKKAFDILIKYIHKKYNPAKIEISSKNPTALELYKKFGFAYMETSKSKKIKEKYGEILLTKIY